MGPREGERVEGGGEEVKRELEESAKVQHDNGERFVTSSHSIFSALP